MSVLNDFRRSSSDIDILRYLRLFARHFITCRCLCATPTLEEEKGELSFSQIR